MGRMKDSAFRWLSLGNALSLLDSFRVWDSWDRDSRDKRYARACARGIYGKCCPRCPTVPYAGRCSYRTAQGGRQGRAHPPPPVAAPSGGTTRAWGLQTVFSPHIPASLWGIPTYSRLARPGGAGSCAAIRSVLEEYRLYRSGGCRACDGCHSCAGETRHPFPTER